MRKLVSFLELMITVSIMIKLLRGNYLKTALDLIRKIIALYSKSLNYFNIFSFIVSLSKNLDYFIQIDVSKMME